MVVSILQPPYLGEYEEFGLPITFFREIELFDPENPLPEWQETSSQNNTTTIEKNNTKGDNVEDIVGKNQETGTSKMFRGDDRWMIFLIFSALE